MRNVCLCTCPCHFKRKRLSKKHKKILLEGEAFEKPAGFPSLEECLHRFQQHQTLVPFWVEAIRDLLEGADYNYSRIAYRIKCSPSTIQKLANHFHRRPRHNVFYPLIALYYRVFQGPFATPKARAFLEQKQLSKKPPVP